MNVLLTSVGRRNYLIAFFKKALASSGGVVVGTDMDSSTAGLAEVDRPLVVPPIVDPSYPNRILEICASESIDLVACLNDMDLVVLSPLREHFERLGATPLFPGLEEVLLCADKLKTYKALTSAGVDTARTWESVEAFLDTPKDALPREVIVKARFGSASIAIEIVTEFGRLEETWKRVSGVAAGSAIGALADSGGNRAIVQERLRGQELGLDIANDLNGRFAALAAKRKLAMRAGETDRAEIVPSDAFEDLARKIGELVGHRGNLDADVFVTPGRTSVLELNPRFGGGYPFAHEAGFNLVSALVRWKEGGVVVPESLKAKPGLTFAKVDRLVRVPAPKNKRDSA